MRHKERALHAHSYSAANLKSPCNLLATADPGHVLAASWTIARISANRRWRDAQPCTIAAGGLQQWIPIVALESERGWSFYLAGTLKSIGRGLAHLWGLPGLENNIFGWLGTHCEAPESVLE